MMMRRNGRTLNKELLILNLVHANEFELRIDNKDLRLIKCF